MPSSKKSEPEPEQLTLFPLKKIPGRKGVRVKGPGRPRGALKPLEQLELFPARKLSPWEKGLETYKRNVGPLKEETVSKLRQLLNRFQLPEKYGDSPEAREFFSDIHRVLFMLRVKPRLVKWMDEHTWTPGFKDIPPDRRMEAIAGEAVRKGRLVKAFEQFLEWKRKQQKA